MADINHKLDNQINDIQRPKKQLSEAKLKAMEKMKAGREAWLKEKKRCEEAGLPPPISKKKAAQQKKVQIKEEQNVEMNITEATEQESPEINVENNIIVPKNAPVKKRKEPKQPPKKKQVVVNNYYEEVVEEEESESSSEEEEEEEIVNNHYRRYTTNPNPQWRLNNNQKTIRFV